MNDSAHLACSYFSRSCVDVFDLESAPDDPVAAGRRPLLRLNTSDTRGRGRGNGGCFFLDENSIVALDNDAVMRLWDVRAHSNTPKWVLRRAAPMMINGRRGAHCLCASNDKTTLFCSGGDQVFGWDPRNLVYVV